MIESQNFVCASSSKDTLDAASFALDGVDSVFAMVIKNEDGSRANVMLDVEDCQRLRDYLTDHIAQALITPAL